VLKENCHATTGFRETPCCFKERKKSYAGRTGGKKPCTLITIFLFFFVYVIMIPAVVVEILVLYRGYEYLSTES
jgi:hypothetical protein